MKVQIRQSVFETNSSSVHSLSIFKKEDWKKFEIGEMYIDDYYRPEIIQSIEECRKEYEEKGKRYNSFEDWLHDNRYTYEDIYESYEIETKEVPDSDYIAVSIYGYE